jgi:hypothetical protein
MAPSAARHRRGLTIRSGTVAALVGSMLATGAMAANAAPASADPIAARRSEATALAHKIDAQGRQMQVLAEHYDGARLHAEVIDQQLGAAQQTLGVAQAQAWRARADPGLQALEASIQGGYLSPPRTSPLSGHVDLAVQKDYFELAINNEGDPLDRMRAAERNLDEQRPALVTTQRDARDAVTALAGRQKAAGRRTKQLPRPDLLGLRPDPVGASPANGERRGREATTAMGSPCGPGRRRS